MSLVAAAAIVSTMLGLTQQLAFPGPTLTSVAESEFDKVKDSDQQDNLSTSKQEFATDENRAKHKVLTPVQESYQRSVEKLKSEGKPYPKVTFETEVTVPEPSERAASIESKGTFESKIAAKTIIEYDGPQEAGKERWDDIIVENPDSPPSTTANVNVNSTGELVQLRGNLTQMLIDEYPEIYEDGDGKGRYQYGEEPRTFVIEETLDITFAESDNAPFIPQDNATSSIQTKSSNMVMGFSYVPTKIEEKVRAEVKVLRIFTIAAAEAELLLDVAYGLRLPVNVDVTRPESMVAGREYFLETSITPLDFAAEDYEKMGLPAENGHEFFARVEGFAGLKGWLFNSLIIDESIDTEMDIGKECSIQTGIDCQNFVTPFGLDEGGIPREFPIPSLYLSPDDTGLELGFAPITVGVGLKIDPEVGADNISAEWTASGDASANGTIVYTKASPAQYPIGPIIATGDFGSNSAGQEYSNNTVAITLDSYGFHLTRQIIGLYGNLQLELLGRDLVQSKYYELYKFNFASIFGEPVLGQHEGVRGISSTVSVIADEENSDVEQIKNDIMSISGVVGVSVNGTYVNVMLKDIESTILVPTQIGDRQVFRDVSGPICPPLANDTKSCQDALEELGNEEFVAAKLLNVTAVSSVSFKGETIVVFAENDEARKAIPDRISGRTVILDVDTENVTVDKPDVAECSESFNGEISAPYNAASTIDIVSLHGTYNVDFDYVITKDDHRNSHYAHSNALDPHDVTLVEKETIFMELESSNQPHADDIILYHKDVSDCDILFHPSSIPPNKQISLPVLSITQSEPLGDTYFVKAVIPDKASVGEDFSKLVVAYSSNPEAEVWYTVPNVKIIASDASDCTDSFRSTSDDPWTAKSFLTIDSANGPYDVEFDYSQMVNEHDDGVFDDFSLNLEPSNPTGVKFVEGETISMVVSTVQNIDNIATLYQSDVADCNILFDPSSIPADKKLVLQTRNVTLVEGEEYLVKVAIPSINVATDVFSKLVIFFGDTPESTVYYVMPNVDVIPAIDNSTKVSITNSTLTKTTSARGSEAPDITPPTVSASPSGGTYPAAQSVTLAANEPAAIYYTTDGSDPTSSSIVYYSPIPIANATTTLKFYGVDTAGNPGLITTLIYAISPLNPETPEEDTTMGHSLIQNASQMAINMPGTTGEKAAECAPYIDMAYKELYKSPEDWNMVSNYLSVIKCVSLGADYGTSPYGGVVVQNGTYIVPTSVYAGSSATWLASNFVHEACHVKQYQQSGSAWGLAAEIECADIKLNALEAIGAPASEIDYTKYLIANTTEENGWWNRWKN